MRLHRIMLIIAAAFLAASSASGQDRDTVFIHGLASDAGTWNGAAGRLSPQLAIRPHQTNLNWRALYEAQAVELDQKVGGSLGANAIAVGHSNGGVIARQWSRNRGLGSLITLGSPNQGAPIVDHIFEWFTFLDDILARVSNVNAVFVGRVNHDAWWWLPAQWAARFAFGVDVRTTAGYGLLALGLDYRLPVIPEMRVWSSYMANLNAAASRDREASAVPARAAIVNVAKDFDHGGPMRIVAPDNYDAWHDAINAAGIGLEGLAGIVRILADGRDLAAFDLADEISGVADWFLQFEEVWCRAVSDPSPLPIARCLEHDGIVPAWSQAYDYPRLPLIVRTDGPVHTRETEESDEQLYQALTTIAQVGARPVAPVPDAPPQPSLGPNAPPAPPAAPPVSPPPVASPAPSTPPATPPATEPSGRFKLNGGACVWDPTDTGPDQCSPLPPSGRFKFDGWGTCYWEPNDYPPDQCSPPAPPTGRFKLGAGGCYWDAGDSGPDQCAP